MKEYVEEIDVIRILTRMSPTPNDRIMTYNEPQKQ